MVTIQKESILSEDIEKCKKYVVSEFYYYINMNDKNIICPNCGSHSLEVENNFQTKCSECKAQYKYNKNFDNRYKSIGIENYVNKQSIWFVVREYYAAELEKFIIEKCVKDKYKYPLVKNNIYCGFNEPRYRNKCVYEFFEANKKSIIESKKAVFIDFFITEQMKKNKEALHYEKELKKNKEYLIKYTAERKEIEGLLNGDVLTPEQKEAFEVELKDLNLDLEDCRHWIAYNMGMLNRSRELWDKESEIQSKIKVLEIAIKNNTSKANVKTIIKLNEQKRAIYSYIGSIQYNLSFTMRYKNIDRSVLRDYIIVAGVEKFDTIATEKMINAYTKEGDKFLYANIF